MKEPKSSTGPPKWAIRFLEWFCHYDYLEDIEGDLLERFEHREEQLGLRKARRHFVREVLTLFRPSLMKPIRFFHPTIHHLMFKNHLKIAWRGLFKNRSYSLINIGGLAIAMLVPILIGLWMHDELTFDHQFANSDRLALVMQNQTFNGDIQTWYGQAMQLEPALKEDFGDQFKHVITTTGNIEELLTYEDQKITKSGRYMGPAITDMLSLNLIQGTRAALADPRSIILAASTAEALFGAEDPMGKSIFINHDLPVTVNGIYEDLPANSSFADLQFIAPWELRVQDQQLKERVEWGNSWFNTLVQIGDQADMERVSALIKDVKYKHIDPDFAKKSNPQLWLFPMKKWRLHSEFEHGIIVGGRIEYVRMFGFIGLVILLLGCINFMNLSTARSEKRAREVGIRKTLGSVRAQLISQFYSESMLISTIAFVVALILAVVMIPAFNEVADKEVRIMWSNPWFWTLCLGFTFFTGLLAGSYPALYLSGFRPVKVLKGTFRLGRFAALPRKILVVVQFTVSISLIIATIFIFRQIEYAKDRPIGYNRDNLIRVPIKSDEILTHYDALRSDLLNTGLIEEMAGTDSPVTSTGVTNGGFTWEGMDPSTSNDFTSLRVTYEFGDMVDWEIIAGRDFSRDFATDSSAIILNEAAVAYMGLENPVGTIMERGENRHEIVGVVKNLITQSPYAPVRQTIFMHHESWLNQINIKLKPDSRAHDALTAIESIFEKYDPINTFEYHFADEEYARKFKNEERIGKLASFFAILAVLISCLGLFGLASYVAEQRTKEIGIRKVLGASVASLWQLLSKDFILLVIISCVVAAPIAYLITNDWLEDFSYHTEFSWWIFGLVGLVAIMIALATVSFQALRAAFMNPASTIKSD